MVVNDEGLSDLRGGLYTPLGSANIGAVQIATRQGKPGVQHELQLFGSPTKTPRRQPCSKP